MRCIVVFCILSGWACEGFCFKWIWLFVKGELYAISWLFSKMGQCLARFIESFLPAGETYHFSLFRQQPRVGQQSWDSYIIYDFCRHWHWQWQWHLCATQGPRSRIRKNKITYSDASHFWIHVTEYLKNPKFQRQGTDDKIPSLY